MNSRRRAVSRRNIFAFPGSRFQGQNAFSFFWNGERRKWSDATYRDRRLTVLYLNCERSHGVEARNFRRRRFDEVNQIRARTLCAIRLIKFRGSSSTHRDREKEENAADHGGGLRRLCAAGESFGAETARERKFPRTFGNKKPGARWRRNFPGSCRLLRFLRA